MNLLNGKSPNEGRIALESVFLVANAFIWFFYSMLFLEDNINAITKDFLQADLIWSIYFGTLVGSLIIGGILKNKIGRRRLFLFWTLLGVFSPIVLLLLNFAQPTVAVLIFILFAVSTGLGMPNCMEYFTRSTNTATRGRYAGLIFLLSVLGLFLLRIIGGGIELSAFILIVWRLFGLLALFKAESFKMSQEKVADISYRSILSQKSFILYLVPWIMFSLVNYLSVPIQVNILGQAMVTKLQLIENIIGPLSSIPAGFMIDYIGRKQAAMGGFALLGLSYAFLGLYPKDVTSWYFYTVFDGITWGIISVLFVVCIWGELNQNAPTDKYYAMGILPFFISEFLSLILTNYISFDVSPYALFSFIAFFLFIAVLPLVYAPETLPEKFMKDRDIKSYVEKARRVKEKSS